MFHLSGTCELYLLKVSFHFLSAWINFTRSCDPLDFGNYEFEILKSASPCPEAPEILVWYLRL